MRAVWHTKREGRSPALVLRRARRRWRAGPADRVEGERLEAVLKAAALAVHEYDPRTGAIYWDGLVRSWWGLDDDEVVTYEKFEQGVHPADRARVNGLVEASLDPHGSRRYVAEYRVINRKDGQVRWVRAVGDVTFEGETPVRLVGAVQDITARIAAEAALTESRAELNRSNDALREVDRRNRELLHALRLALVAADAIAFEWRPQDDRVTRLFGDLPGLPTPGPRMDDLVQTIHPEDRGVFRANIAAAMAGAPYRSEYRAVRPDGQVRWLQEKGQVERDENGAILRLAGISIDMTERRRQEAFVQESEARHAFLLRLSDVLRPLSEPAAIQAMASRVLGEHFFADRVGYAEIDESTATIEVVRNYVAGLPDLQGRYTFDQFGRGLVDLLRRGETIVRRNVAEDASLADAERDVLSRLGLAAAVTVPLVKDDQLIALFFVHLSHPRDWSTRDIALIEDTAERTWAATEQARSEEELRESEARYRAIFEHAGVGKAEVDASTGRFIRVNARFAEIMRCAKEDLIGRMVIDIMHPEDRGDECFAMGPLMRGEQPVYSAEKRYVRADGSVVWVDVNVGVVRDDDGRALHNVVTVHDITDRKRFESELAEREREARFLALLRDALDAESEPDRILGVATRMLAGHLGVNVVNFHEIDENRDFVRVHSAFSCATPTPGEHKLSGIYAGETIADLRRGRAIVVEDVRTDARTKERAGLFLRFGQASCLCLPMIVGDRLVGTLAIADSAPRSWGRAVEVARAVAERVWYSHRSAVLLAGLKASESRLRDSEAQLRRVLDQLFVFVAVVTPQGVLLDTNQAPLSAGDLSHEDVAGRRFTETYWWLHDRAAAARVEGAIKRAAAGDTIRFDIDVQLAQGRRETVDFQIGPLRDRQGAITHLIASLVPIGDRVRAEAELRRLKEELEDLVEKRTASLMHANLRLTEEMEQRVTAQNALAQAQKLEALGHLTAGIAHDFNNAIAAIGSGFNLIRKWSTDPRVVTIANHGDEAAARSAGLVKQLLAFARQQPLRPTRICIYDALMAAEPLIRRSVGPGVQLDLQCPEDIGACTVDPVSLETALINLSVNARDAMPMGGALRIGARRLEAGDPALPAELKARAGMAIAIADEGLGMSAEVLQRAIEPFFTTKGPGKGTGLGLAMAHGFVHQSGGAMRIESEPGAGAVVTIFLPATDAGPECACPENHASPRPLPPIDLLVVDDDNAVRAIIAAHLRDMGLTVEDATTADEARTLISARRFDAVLCDVVMPGENGLEVARSLREIQPGVPILFMTGHADRTLLVDEAVIDKPFAMEDLIAALSAVMARVPA